MHKMHAGMLLISALVGKMAIIVALALSLPTWMVILSYPVVGSLALLFTAALYSIRSKDLAPVRHMVRSQA
ncbi:MAG TPA: hypothetical protein VI412_03760 [Tabrizicola sp.]|jgi:hypothetical protein